MAFIEYVYQDDAKVVEHKPLEVLEPGPAQFKITRVTDHTSKEGKHSTKLSVLVTRGDKRTFCDQYISERTGFKVKQIEEATGVAISRLTGKKDAQGRDIAVIDTDAFMGLSGACEVIKSTYQEKERNEIAKFISLGSARASKPEEAKPALVGVDDFEDCDIPF